MGRRAQGGLAKALETGTFLHSSPAKYHGEIVERGLCIRGISMGALLEKPGEGAALLGALKVMKGRLWGWASRFMGAQLGKLEWAHLPGTLRYGCKGLWRWSVSLCGSSVKGTWREGSLAGDPEGYVEKALEMGVSFCRGPIWGT